MLYYSDFNNDLDSVYENLELYSYNDYVAQFITNNTIDPDKLSAVKKGFYALRSQQGFLREENYVVLLAIDTVKEKIDIIQTVKYKNFKHYMKNQND